MRGDDEVYFVFVMLRSGQVGRAWLQDLRRHRSNSRLPELPFSQAVGPSAKANCFAVCKPQNEKSLVEVRLRSAGTVSVLFGAETKACFRHCRFATILVAVRWGAVLVIAVGETPEPRVCAAVVVDAADFEPMAEVWPASITCPRRTVRRRRPSIAAQFSDGFAARSSPWTNRCYRQARSSSGHILARAPIGTMRGVLSAASVNAAASASAVAKPVAVGRFCGDCATAGTIRLCGKTLEKTCLVTATKPAFFRSISVYAARRCFR